MTTPSEIARTEQTRRRDAFTIKDSDGFVICMVKTVFGVWLLHGPHEWFIYRSLLRRASSTIEKSETDATADFKKAVDRYWVFCTVVLVLLYIVVWLVVRSNPNWLGKTVLGAIVLACAFRVLEILATEARLNILVLPYKTATPDRALLLVFAGIAHVMICFAIFYLVNSWAGNDTYVADDERPALYESMSAPIYFSAVTIATVGYGDFSPKRWLGRLLVVLEIGVGFMMIVVAFQRVLAANADGRPKHDDDSRPR